MKKKLSCLSLSLCSLFFLFAQVLLTEHAHAAVQSYVVAPFKINGSSQYNYLEQSVSSMLASRLFWSGQYETSTQQDSITKASPPTSRDSAQKLLSQARAQYIFYGAITILGSEASIDITALASDGQQWKKASSSHVDSLITALQGMADSFSSEIFKRPTQQQSSQGFSQSPVPLSGNFVLTETGREQTYLNPEFRYQGQANERLRSQSLDFAAVSMDIGDFSNSGTTDIVFADESRTIYLYSWNGGAMKKLATYRLPSSQRPLAVRGFSTGGKTLIAVSAFAESDTQALGTILEYNGKELVPVKERLPYFLNTTFLPDLKRPILIGQSFTSSGLFRGSVFQLLPQGNDYVKGPALPNLPSTANVFNFTYIPDSEDPKGYKVAILNKSEKIQMYSSSGSRLHQTDEVYSGGNAYIRTSDGSAGASFYDDVVEFFYIPMRMVSVDLDANGQFELLANKPISTAAKIFTNFRNYSQGEIQSLIWDGVGLSLLWKTKSIKGTVADFQIADPNNDNVLDLVTCVVTYPGSFGTGERKTVLTLFPLDISLTNPNTPANYN